MRCNGCETEINGKLEDHYDRSLNCKIWIDLMNDETNVANVAKTIQDVYIEQTQHSLTCDNCEATYSNLGNINKHYKNHPECLKINLFNNIMKKSKTDEERHCVEYSSSGIDITQKDYYHNWPDSTYNKDLLYAKNSILDYLKEPRKVSSQKECIVFDLDETLIFGDPSETMGIREMELGTSTEGHSIFALPIIKEIVEVARYAKSIGLYVVVMSARPKESYTATVTNLNMFGVEYDELIHDNDENMLASEYKSKNFEILSKKYDIICTVGDQEIDCYSNNPFSVKLPDPESMKIKLYSKHKMPEKKEVPKEVLKPIELGTYVFDKCLRYAELPVFSSEITANIYTTSIYSSIDEERFLSDQTSRYSNRMEYINDNGSWIFGEYTSNEITREISQLTKIFMTSDTLDLISNGTSKTNKIIDKTQWSSGEWIDEPDYLEWTDEETGYVCKIERVESILEGYVGISYDHYRNLTKDNKYSDLKVHGGGLIRHQYGDTYGDTMCFLGFDCGRFGDFCPYICVYEIDGTPIFRPRGIPQDYRNIDYVKNEINKLISQLKEFE